MAKRTTGESGEAVMDTQSATKLLYATDSYLSGFTARVVASEGRSVALDQTAFYPGGGGQMADQGNLMFEGRRLAIAGMSKRDGVVWHELAEGVGEAPPVGATVTGEVDWPFRYHMMRTHTALHLLCGLIFRDYGAQVTGGQMYPDRARMDFALAGMTPDFLHAIERSVNEAVAADHPIKVYELTRAKAMKIPDLIRTKINLLPPEIKKIRIVEIVGVDLQADGGTHVSSTREVGGITVLRTENKGKQNKRMEIALTDGDRA